MADKEDVSLPKVTVSKFIKDLLPQDIKCANDTRDVILECCVEFIHLISAEANEICNRENKKTIAAEHILKALKELGFGDYCQEVTEVYDQHKVEALQEKPKVNRKLENLGIPQEELLKEQQRLFEKAKTALSRSQEIELHQEKPF